MKMPVTVIVYVRSAEKTIEDCIKSALLLSDSVIAVDMGSEDNTMHILETHHVPVFEFPQTDYVEPAREFGIKKAKTPWVFLLDSDERITQDLVGEIRHAINDGSITHYEIPRKEIVFSNIWLKHGGWWPNYQMRLFRVDRFEEWPKRIHSFPLIKGAKGTLTHPFLHFSKNDYNEIVRRTVTFESLESDLLFRANKSVSTPTFFRKYFGELFRRLIAHGGLLDGSAGIIESIYQAYSKTVTYLFLYEKKYIKSRTV